MTRTKEKTPLAGTSSVKAVNLIDAEIRTTPSVAQPTVTDKPQSTDDQRRRPDPRIARAQIRLVDFEQRFYEVESDSRPGTWHRVKYLDGHFCCTCPAGSHDTPCWHIQAVVPRLWRDLRRQTARLNAEIHDMLHAPLVPTAARYQLALLQADHPEPVFAPQSAVWTEEVAS